MRRLLGLLIIVPLLLTACGPPSARGATPEEAAQRILRQTASEASAIHLQGTDTTPYGTVVIYTAQYVATDEQPAYSYFGSVLAELRGESWVTIDGRMDLIGSQQYPPASIRLSGHFLDRDGRILIVDGVILKPEVATVEVTFNNGETARDTVTPEGVFALAAEDVFSYCSIRTLDAQDQVVETIRTQAANGCDPGVSAP
jgi:hypothetical protein